VRFAYWPRPAKVAAVIAVVVCILEIATVSVLLPSALRAWRDRDHSELAMMLDGLCERPEVSTAPLSEEAFAADLREIAAGAEYTAGVNPFLLAFTFFGYLASREVPLSPAALEALASPSGRGEVITTQSDTWRSLADHAMGDADLWPLLMALNYHRYVKVNGAQLRENQRLLVPRSPADAEGR